MAGALSRSGVVGVAGVLSRSGVWLVCCLGLGL